MKITLKDIVLLLAIAAILAPACLAIYQYFQFGKVTLDLSLMSPDAIARTITRSMLAAVLMFAALKLWCWLNARRQPN
ncbi:hypothetical protein VHN57_05855 [Sphingobium sp. WW5]|uniref:hypothetical protein n=1 Tax=unclassified Sphingobium TaxID=2611147 RepID=UPI003C21B951